MHTYVLGDDDVRRFAKSLASRLEAMGPGAPKTWFTLGVSGDRMAVELGKLLLASARPATVHKLSCIRPSNHVAFRGGEPAQGELAIDCALVIDGAVHSGGSFLASVNFLHSRGVKSIISYSLIVKRTSNFIPTYFGLLIGEHDRAYFQLDEIPNNRLSMSVVPAPPFGHMRAISADDAKGPPRYLKTGTPSIDGMSFADLWYDVRAHGKKVYFYEVDGKIAGLVSFKIQQTGVMLLDTIARDLQFKRQDVGGIMWRWAETFARSSRCPSVELWAIENRVAWYQTLGFEEVPGEFLDLGPSEKYKKMRRRLLYNVKPEDLLLA
jgi:N-acetylglutamate synthase-like GNAT family acetyltransferase